MTSLTKAELHALADTLIAGSDGEIARCVAFVIAETNGFWHGRARAMMCRRLKHCQLSPEQRQQLVQCITRRLATGNFSEQFRDQLRLALALDSQYTFQVARRCLAGPCKDHVRRLALWVTAHQPGE
ncbi:MAG: hypothetical protein HY820_37660 [Acidobacteria bacterium]|nr:hypothetical protein [Acidobacteriota bacterium]